MVIININVEQSVLEEDSYIRRTKYILRGEKESIVIIMQTESVIARIT